MCVCVAGIGRFNNQTYVEFLRVWDATRKLKTKIGPAEVRAYVYTCSVFSYACSSDMYVRVHVADACCPIPRPSAKLCPYIFLEMRLYPMDKHYVCDCFFCRPD